MEEFLQVGAIANTHGIAGEVKVFPMTDDIKRFNIDIFTVGSDWEGYFDYLNEYCKVVYLPRIQEKKENYYT